MRTAINELLVASINSTLPEGEKLVSFLMDLLNLSRESTYRRIRNEIPFTFEEIITISVKLGLSLDEIAGQYQKNRAFFDIHTSQFSDPASNYIEVIERTGDIYKKIQDGQKSEIIFTTNQLAFPFYMLFENLSRFCYYKWVHQTQDVPLNFHLSDFEYPTQIDSAYKKYRYTTSRLNQITGILCPNFILSIIKEVAYFYQRKLITRDELLLIQEDLFKVLERLEKITQKGMNDYDIKVDFYSSSLDISVSSIWFRSGSKTGIQFWHYPDPLTIHNPNTAQKHKTWIESLLKYSTLISQCNEIQRSDFFNKQNEFVKKIEEIAS